MRTEDSSGARPGSGTGAGRPVMCEECILMGDTGIPPQRKVLVEGTA